MARQYDAVVIGSGPAGGQAAKDLCRAGLKVAVAESYGFGGTCPLRGCEPKKILIDAAEAVARTADMADQGVIGPAGMDWTARVNYVKSFVSPISDRVESYLNHIGIDTYFGQARFVGRDEITVDDERIKAKQFLIASGAKPRPLGLKGKEHVSSSDDVFRLDTLPQRIVFVGGGFISFELSHVAVRAGAKPIILEVFDRPLAPFDPDLVEMLVQGSREAGIDLHVKAPVMSVEKKEGRFIVTAGEDRQKTFEADLVVHGAGRVPALAGLDPSAAGVEVSSRGVKVNDFLQSSSNPNVYAAGDAAATSHPLTPVATMEGRIAAHNMIHGNTLKVDHRGIPSAVFTHPPLASVGLREEDAEQKWVKFKTIFKDTSNWSEHQRIGLKHTGFKVLIDEEHDRIIGAHILGDRAEEVINIFAMAIQHDLSLSQIRSTIWSYPSSIYNTRYVLG